MPYVRDYPSASAAEDIIRDHRARVAIEEETRIVKRLAAQAEQCETSTTPEARIRAWEKLHELRLPSDAGHPIVTIIALATHLSQLLRYGKSNRYAGLRAIRYLGHERKHEISRGILIDVSRSLPRNDQLRVASALGAIHRGVRRIDQAPAARTPPAVKGRADTRTDH